jgi:hypothetical protein
VARPKCRRYHAKLPAQTTQQPLGEQGEDTTPPSPLSIISFFLSSDLALFFSCFGFGDHRFHGRFLHLVYPTNVPQKISNTKSKDTSLYQ